MKVQIYGKNITVSAGIQEKVESKLKVLDKYIIIGDDVIANVVVRVYHPKGQKIEVTIPTKLALLRAEVTHDDLYAAIDLVIDKLEDQIRRQKTRLSRKGKEGLSTIFMEEEAKEEEEQVVRTKTIVPEEMDLEEAIMRMEMIGHAFFIYTDEDTKEIAVVYKRTDTGYGCIETSGA